MATRSPMAPGFGRQPGGFESSLLVPWRGEKAAAWPADCSDELARPPTLVDPLTKPLQDKAFVVL